MKKSNIVKIKLRKAQEKAFLKSQGVLLKLRVKNLNSGETEW